MKTFTIKKGHNLKIEGVPVNKIIKVSDPDIVLFHPSSLKNTKIKLLVKENEHIKIGTPLFYDKNNHKVLYVSSCSGNVTKISFGPRRIVESIIIKNDKLATKLPINNKVSVNSLLNSGLFSYIRQKPFSKVPHFDSKPKSIFISSMPTEPFAIDYEYLMNQDVNYLQQGIDVLKQLYDCDIYFTSAPNSKFSDLSNVRHITFNKLHPAGNVGIQIHKIDPIKNKNDVRWYLSLQDLDRIGQFFKEGECSNNRYINVGGNAFENPSIFKILIGTSIHDIIKTNFDNNIKIISGDVLSGKRVNIDNTPGYYDEILSLIKTDSDREFLGWLRPGIDKYSLTNTFFSKLIFNRKSKITTKKNGSIRTIIPLGNWDKVMPMNIMIEYLVKNILIKDIDMMEKLGIYECSPEDFALCSFACQSKVEVSHIIEQGLDLVEVED